MNTKLRIVLVLENHVCDSVARRVLSLLYRVPKTEWRNKIIPFPAIYKKVGYVMKLDRVTTRKVLILLAMENMIEIVRSHGVILPEGMKIVRGTNGPQQKTVAY